MYWDYEKYAKNAINRHFPEIEQEEIKEKYIKVLYKADNAIRDLVKNVFDESAQDYLRDVWAKISRAVINDMQQITNLNRCDYLDSNDIRNIRESILENNKEEIYNDVLKDKDENIKDLISQLKHIEKENQQLREQLYG
jgi:hypothetical protein